MVIVLVLAQMLGKVRNAPREHRNLHLGRPRVPLVRAVLPYNLRFLFSHNQLLVSPLYLVLSCLTNSTPYATTRNELGISNYDPGPQRTRVVIHSGVCGAKAARLRLSHQATRASGGMIHHPNTSVDRIAAVSACKTVREAFHDLATTSAGSQAGGGVGGLVTGWMLSEIRDMSLLCLRYCILPWTCSIWPRTAVSSRWMVRASCTSSALLYRSRSDCSAASKFRSRDCKSTYSSVTSWPETVSVVTFSPIPLRSSRASWKCSEGTERMRSAYTALSER